MLYAMVRALAGTALRLFYRVRVRAMPGALGGPVLFVGNHPNSIIDPALLFAVVPREVTFLAKAPLFDVPVFGRLIRALGALPVYRRQDEPKLTERNEGTIAAAAEALARGGAITIFPEGRSHSEPRLAEIKTGAARIAMRAVSAGARVTVVPVGLTYGDKHRFRSEVLVEAGAPIAAADVAQGGGEDAVHRLTEEIDTGLQKVTLNLERWEDLPLVKVGEELYAAWLGDRARDPDRMRRFGRGIELFRREQPERFEKLRREVLVFQRRLELVRARPRDLGLDYHRVNVWRFAGRNLAALLFGFPLFALGVAIYALPFHVPRWLNGLLRQPLDRQGTVKFFSALVLAPLWLALLGYGGWRLAQRPGMAICLAGALPLALFTRYFLEQRKAALRDVRVFLSLSNRRRLQLLLRAEGDRLAEEIDRAASEYRPRVLEPLRSSHG